MITAKLRPPPPPAVLIERPRVQGALSRAAEGHGVVLLVAGAGSGKTTEAARFLEGRPGRTAWLSVDPSDRASGRFVSYLAAALGRVEPSLESMVKELLADGLPADDCAALLAERMGQGWTIVVDDLHHLEPDAQALGPLRRFVRGLPAGALAVLVSRRIPSLVLSSELLRGTLSGVFDAELAFDLDETGALLRAHAASGDPEDVLRATGGWAAGIVFEALRRPGSSGLPPDEDPLFAYLGGEILEGLPGRIRRALLRSAVLDTVTAERLEEVARESPPVQLY
jgi:ATP/maltotriose-dependent transcriptional regulator MalT